LINIASSQQPVIRNCRAEGVAIVSSLDYLSGNTTSECSEAATAYTAER